VCSLFVLTQLVGAPRSLVVGVGSFTGERCDRWPHFWFVRRELSVFSVRQPVGHVVVLVPVDALARLPRAQHSVQDSGTALVLRL
jgi:hypothetical protein